MTGVVTVDREATVRFVVRGLAGVEQQIEAVIDTGFLTLPPRAHRSPGSRVARS